MAKEPGKREFRLEFSDRNGAVELEGHLADARRIQNVLFADVRTVADAEACVRAVRAEAPGSGGIHGRSQPIGRCRYEDLQVNG